MKSDTLAPKQNDCSFIYLSPFIIKEREKKGGKENVPLQLRRDEGVIGKEELSCRYLLGRQQGQPNRRVCDRVCSVSTPAPCHCSLSEARAETIHTQTTALMALRENLRVRI